jgi:hypothetical protein
MQTDDDLEIKILEILSRSPQTTKKELFDELFDWLVDRRFKSGLPDTRDEFRQLLKNDISQELYRIALARGWVSRVQTRRYTRYSFVDRPPRPALEDDVFRLATAEELRSKYWASRFAYWELEFLRRRKALAAHRATVPEPSQGRKGGKRGPAPSIPQQQIDAIIKARGGEWRTESALESICDELDQKNIDLPKRWAKWARKPRSWVRAMEYQKRLVIKQLEYSLKMTRSQ